MPADGRQSTGQGDEAGRATTTRTVIAESRQAGRPLNVDFAQESYAPEHFGKIFQCLDDEKLLERVAVLPGREPQNTRVIIRLKVPASADRRDGFSLAR